MSDIDKRLDNIEQKLQIIATQQTPMFANHTPSPREDEIDLRELFNVLWQSKWVIIAITFLFAVAGVFYALSLPNMYKSEGVYAPAQKQSGVSGLGGQLGGLASLAGVNIGGGESNDIDQAMVLLTSWPFLEKVIEKHNLKPLIMGVKGWNRNTGELIWNTDIYDPVAKKWLREPPKGQKPEPSSYETFEKFKNMIQASNDAKTGMLKIAVEYFSPVVAQQWVELLVKELNQTFKTRDKAEAEKNITYLNNKINETSLAQMQSVFYDMIEAQTQTLMLAEVGEEYLLKKVIEAKVPELKSAPSRSVLCIVFILLGGFIGVVYIFTVSLFKGEK